MGLEELGQLMVKHGLVIRAIPYESTGVFEAHHKDKYPDGEVVYLEQYKREMLKVTFKHSQGGKFIVAKVSDQRTTINSWEWLKSSNKKIAFYDTVQQAIDAILDGTYKEV